MFERLSDIATAACPKVLKAGKLPATRSKRKDSLVRLSRNRQGVKLDAENAREAELEASTTELEEQLEHSSSQVRVAEAKHSLFY